MEEPTYSDSVGEELTNPYKSPRTQGQLQPEGVDALSWLVPPALSIGATLVFWLSFAGVLGSFVRANTAMYYWAGTLLTSVLMSTCFVSLLWRRAVSPLAMATWYIFFGVAFCYLEGDTSNGTDRVQAIILYGTLALVPFVAFAVSWYLKSFRIDRSRNSTGAGGDSL